MAPVKSIDEVLKRLRTLDAELPADDGVRWFNRLYLGMTENVVASIEAAGGARPTFLERLDVVFANAYFQAVDAAGTGKLPRDYPYDAWKPLFEARRRRDAAPVQFALAGVNAHINHDLAIGIQRTCQERRVKPDPGTPHHREYQSVNGVLQEAYDAAERWLLTGALQELDRRFSPVDDLIVIWSLKRARAAAWTRAQILWEMRDNSFAERAYRELLDHSTGLSSRAFLKRVPFVEGGPEVLGG
jgi:Family of unknown function (DUF5995)